MGAPLRPDTSHPRYPCHFDESWSPNGEYASGGGPAVVALGGGVGRDGVDVAPGRESHGGIGGAGDAEQGRAFPAAPVTKQGSPADGPTPYAREGSTAMSSPAMGAGAFAQRDERKALRSLMVIGLPSLPARVIHMLNGGVLQAARDKPPPTAAWRRERGGTRVPPNDRPPQAPPLQGGWFNRRTAAAEGKASGACKANVEPAWLEARRACFAARADAPVAQA